MAINQGDDMKPTLLDRLIGQLNPDAGLRRLRSRQLLSRAYEGASKRDGWKPRRPNASANTDHAIDAGTLRARARSLVQNTPYIARGLDSLVANTIGTGIVPRSLAKNAEAVDKIFANWSRVADADARFDLYGLQAAAYRAMEQDGEVLIRLRIRRNEDGLPVPLQLQLLEIDWLDSYKNGTAGTNTIVNGIEYDALGRITQYWLFDKHPGEQSNFKAASSYPVAADRIIHLFNPQRPGQGRGFTRLAPVIARVRDLQLYEDAELQRKNLETRLSVIASGDVSNMSMTESQGADEVRKYGELGTLASGSITQVAAGTNLTIIEPKAAPGYVEYVKFNLHLIAAGMGVTYPMLTGDVSEGNFSSTRVSTMDFRRGVESTQWLTVIPKLCEVVWRAFIDAAVLGGKLPKADYACDHATPKWDYINPEQDVKADLAEISGGLSTISEKLRRRGYKPDLVFAELKSDFDRLRGDGTLDIMLQIQTGQAPQVNPAPAAAARAAEHATLTAALDKVRDKVSEDGAQQRNLLAALAERVQTSAQPAPTAPPVINITNQVPEQRAGDVHVHMPESVINVEATMPTPVVEVRNEITTPQASVTVNNDVHPATVAVDVTATMPKRVSQTVIERDAKHHIVRSSTTERDA